MAEQNVLDSVPSVDMKFFCRWLVAATEEYFKDEAVQARFQKWLEEKRKREVEEGVSASA